MDAERLGNSLWSNFSSKKSDCMIKTNFVVKIIISAK